MEYSGDFSSILVTKVRIGDDCNEGTMPVTSALRAIDAVNPMDAAFHDAIGAGITSVMVGPGSANVVGGQFVFMKIHGRCIDEMVVKHPAAMKVAFGENPMEVFTETLYTIIDGEIIYQY